MKLLERMRRSEEITKTSLVNLAPGQTITFPDVGAESPLKSVDIIDGPDEEEIKKKSPEHLAQGQEITFLDSLRPDGSESPHKHVDIKDRADNEEITPKSPEHFAQGQEIIFPNAVQPDHLPQDPNITSSDKEKDDQTKSNLKDFDTSGKPDKEMTKESPEHLRQAQDITTPEIGKSYGVESPLEDLYAIDRHDKEMNKESPEHFRQDQDITSPAIGKSYGVESPLKDLDTSDRHDIKGEKLWETIIITGTPPEAADDQMANGLKSEKDETSVEGTSKFSKTAEEIMISEKEEGSSRLSKIILACQILVAAILIVAPIIGYRKTILHAIQQALPYFMNNWPALFGFCFIVLCLVTIGILFKIETADKTTPTDEKITEIIHYEYEQFIWENKKMKAE